MTTVEMLRACGDGISNRAAHEIESLRAVNAQLLAACRMVKDDPGLTAAANEVIRAALERAERTTP